MLDRNEFKSKTLYVFSKLYIQIIHCVEVVWPIETAHLLGIKSILPWTRKKKTRKTFPSKPYHPCTFVWHFCAHAKIYEASKKISIPKTYTHFNEKKKYPLNITTMFV